jgi:predicted O-methyltransferase YrrM
MVLDIFGSDSFRFLATFPPGHYYSPIPDPADLPTNGQLAPESIAGIELNVGAQLALLGRFVSYQHEIPFRRSRSEGCRFWLDNGLYPFGDAIVLYSMLRHLRPRRVVEIGSGFSSAAMLDTCDRFLDRTTEFCFIEPFPERLHRLLRDDDYEQARVIVDKVQAVAPETFVKLQRDDLLFVDSSHVSKAGSDLNHIVFEILPVLTSGVVVHFHDIFWPFEYPSAWLQEGRAWNEAYMLRAFLQHSDAFEVVFFNSYLASVHRDQYAQCLPLALEKAASFPYAQSNSSLWLRKR